MDANPSTGATGHALRVAIAAVVCLVLVEWWHLEHGNLAVWTTNMVLAQYTFTAFQKGLERVVGRGAGILFGLLLMAAFQNAPVVANLLKFLTLLGFFYIYFSGRLAYTFLNAGLYLAVIVEIGKTSPATAATEGWELFLAVLLGVAVADLVVWLAGSEGTMQIQPGGSPQLPIRWDWLKRALVLAVTVELTQFVTSWLLLPTEPSLISIMILTIAPDLSALLRKGEMRLAGAALGSLWGVGMFVVLSRLPHFLLLAAFLFLGMFLAAYLARVGGSYSYAGVQMGLVLPLLVVVPPSEFGTVSSVVQRLEGIAIALVISLLVGGLSAAMPGKNLHLQK